MSGHCFLMHCTESSLHIYSALDARSKISLITSVISARKESSTEAENAASVLYSLYALSTYSVSVCVLPMMFPDITETAPNSPIALCTGEGSENHTASTFNISLPNI